MPSSHKLSDVSCDMIRDSKEPDLPASKLSIPGRPPLKRDQSIPASQNNHFVPSLLPSSLAQQQRQQHFSNDDINNTDSLSLGQLKRLVNDMSCSEPAPYAFTYADTASFRGELEEWFTYDKVEQTMMLATWTSFTTTWEAFRAALSIESTPDGDPGVGWVESTGHTRVRFIESLAKGLQEHDAAERLQYLEALTYLAFGSWYETARPELGDLDESPFNALDNEDLPQDESRAYEQPQLHWIKKNVEIIASCEVIQSVMDMLLEACPQERYKPQAHFCMSTFLIAPFSVVLLSQMGQRHCKILSKF